MTENQLQARKLVARVLEVPLDAVGVDDTIETLEQWDSIGHMHIILEIERMLGVELETEQVLALESVKDVADVLQDDVGQVVEGADG